MLLKLLNQTDYFSLIGAMSGWVFRVNTENYGDSKNVRQLFKTGQIPYLFLRICLVTNIL